MDRMNLTTGNTKSLSRAHKEVLARAIEKGRKNLEGFVQFTKRDYDFQWFQREICRALDKLERGEIKKLMIFIPPQHGKSELSSRRFPAYVLGRNPNKKIAVCSYSSTLAQSFNRSMQMIMDDTSYTMLFPKTYINSSRVSNGTTNGKLRNTEMFEIIEGTGFVKTVGIGGALTGTPVDLGIIDDPFKDRSEANSKVIRDKVWNWYQDVFCTRLHNDSQQLLLFTRWHEDDLAGRLTDPKNEYYDENEAKEWTIIALPALKEETPPHPMAIDIGDPREIDEALWESRHSAEKYRKRRKTNPTGFQSLDQQRPTAQEGNKIRREWFVIKKLSELPFDPNQVPADFIIDGAFTDKTKNDETALMSCYHHKATDTLYVFNCIGVRKELYELLKFFKPYVKSNYYKPQSSVYIELKASGEPLKSMLSKVEHGGFNTRPINNKVVALGKFNRVENAEPFLASGKVVLVEGSWNKPFIDQCASFPNGAHDDMVDDLTYAIHKYFIKKDSNGVSYES